MNETCLSSFAPVDPASPGTPAAGATVDTSPVKRWRRRLVACLTLGLGVLLVAPSALAQGAPDAQEDDDEEEAAPPPPPRPAKKKKAPALPPPDAQPQEAEVEGDAKAPKDTKKEAAPKQPTLEEKALRGVVVVERGGQVLGLGGVLAGDGRILSALSTLGPGNDLEVRYPDGSTARVKVGHHDRVWDLALLVPQSGKWKEGLTASARDPVRQDATIRSFSGGRGKVSAVQITLRGRRSLLGGDDQQLEGVLELGSRVSPQDLGAPIIDEEGRVVGVLGRGCAPNEGGKPCTPVAFGAPIDAIRGFLRSVPATAVQPSGWLGVQVVSDTAPLAKGVRVTSVHPGGPADEAKLKGGDKGAGDLILAVDGAPITTPEALAEAIRTHAVGEKVPFIVFGPDSRYRTVTVVLRAAPDPKAAPSKGPAHPAELPPAGSPRRQAPAALPR